MDVPPLNKPELDALALARHSLKIIEEVKDGMKFPPEFVYKALASAKQAVRTLEAAEPEPRMMTKEESDAEMAILKESFATEVATILAPMPKEEITPSRYQWSYTGEAFDPATGERLPNRVTVHFDFYRLCEILGITHHAQAHALKKIIRAGRGGKPLEQDIDEAIAAAKRWKAMAQEDAAQ